MEISVFESDFDLSKLSILMFFQSSCAISVARLFQPLPTKNYQKIYNIYNVYV
jgi:hypothetical protein